MRPDIYKGHIVHAPVFGKTECVANGYIIVFEGRIKGIYSELPEEYSGLASEDYGDSLIIPSFSDLHLHAPQYAMLGMGMDLQLLEWLNTYTFPLEARYADTTFAREMYSRLANELISCGTTRVSIFSSLHRESTLILMDELERVGITGYAGKVNMDRNCPDYLRETMEESISETLRFIGECEGRSLSPIITPRFTPSCSDELMLELGKIAIEHGLRVQSHLSENPDEIEWVKSLCPDCERYYESYARFSMFNENTLMAHCVFSDEVERSAMRERGVYAVHCPDSNTNIASGIAPVRLMLNEGVRVVLGSDIAGGALLSMMDVLTNAIRLSKLRWLDTNKEEAPLTFAEAFYLATSAGAEYFGAGPGFQAGDKFHALVLDDSILPPIKNLSLEQRLERICYISRGRCVKVCFSDGKKVWDNPI